MCIWWAKEALMSKDIQTGLYVCSECGYQTHHDLEPVHESKIQAGNEMSGNKPYTKAITLTKNKPETSDNPFPSFEEAWKS
jgi:hypothetical protein